MAKQNNTFLFMYNIYYSRTVNLGRLGVFDEAFLSDLIDYPKGKLRVPFKEDSTLSHLKERTYFSECEKRKS